MIIGTGKILKLKNSENTILTDFNGFLMILVPYKRRLGLTREDVQTPVKSRREGEASLNRVFLNLLITFFDMLK